jgi:AraC-like DNA-binding protein
MHVLSLKISISSMVQIAGLLIPLCLGIVALIRGRRFLSNRFLGVFLVLFSLHVSIFALRGREYLLRMPFLLILFDGFPFTYGPLFYFYLRSFLRREKRWPFRDLLHFAPAAADLLFYLLLYLLRGRGYFEAGIRRAFQGNPYWFVPLLDLLKVASGFAYSVAIVVALRRQRRRLRKWAEYRIHRRWLHTLIIGFAATWTVVLILLVSALVLDSSPPARELQTGVQTLVFILFSSVIAVFSLKYPVILNPREARRQIRKNLNLSPEAVGEIRGRLEQAAAEKIFTNPDLSLSSAARSIGVHPNVLSFLINDVYDMGFKEYLNELRLRDFLERAKPRALETSTILGLALDAGFSSKSTFNRVFRERYGSTPREYLKK